MITASHNPSNFNGLKLVINEGDLMSSSEEIDLNNFMNGEWKKPSYEKCYIFIGRDTRESGMEILKYLTKTFNNTNITIIDLGVVHTPYLYWFVEKSNRKEFIDYHGDIKENFYKLKWDNNKKDNLVIDCANGSMSSVRNILKEVFEEKKLDFMFINTGGGLINEDCGSDVCWNKRRIRIWNREGNLSGQVKGFTFDGDGDRILFFEGEINDEYVEVNKVYSGDHFICFYSKFLEKFKDSGLVFTPYSNFGMLDYLKNRDISYSICAPGVKNLIETSHQYKMACIFEYNGHGNIEWDKDKKYDKEIMPYLNLLYSKAGDVIGHCLIILGEFLGGNDFNFFEILPQYHASIKVKDMEMFNQCKTNKLETELIEPEELSSELKEICSKTKNRVVVRPSGTEPIFRVMIEGENGEELYNLIREKINF